MFIFFPKSHFNRFFLSLHSVLSLHFLLKHETGLGFGLRLETPAWWWLTAWWLLDLKTGLGLGFLFSDLKTGLGFGFLFSDLKTTITTCEASHHHGPQETQPVGHAVKERPTPLATSRRRDPPR